jgi:hypothetical protein
VNATEKQERTIWIATTPQELRDMANALDEMIRVARPGDDTSFMFVKTVHRIGIGTTEIRFCLDLSGTIT